LDRGAIRGTVTDPQGAVVPGAKVVVHNVETGVNANLVTNSTGFYLAPNWFRIRGAIEASGFSPVDIQGIRVPTTITRMRNSNLGPRPHLEVSATAQLGRYSSTAPESVPALRTCPCRAAIF
jgi:hypothetical protein